MILFFTMLLLFRFRFFFKSYCPDVNMELLEEYSDDETVLPLVQGKIEGRVEKVPQ